MNRAVFYACALLALLAVSNSASADTLVYDSTHSTLGRTVAIDQQTGNNFYYIGDTATIAPTSSTLTSIQIAFGTSYYNTAGNGPAFDYTPNVTLDLYANAADANSHSNLLGTATVNNVTFHNDGQVSATSHYNYENEQFLNFDFSSQNIVLPSSFVFAYHDTPPAGSNVDGANGFSVGLSDLPASPGVSLQDAFVTYPNSSSGTVIDTTWDAGYNVEARIYTTTAVPLPSSALGGLTLLASLGLVTAIKRSRRNPA